MASRGAENSFYTTPYYKLHGHVTCGCVADARMRHTITDTHVHAAEHRACSTCAASSAYTVRYKASAPISDVWHSSLHCQVISKYSHGGKWPRHPVPYATRFTATSPRRESRLRSDLVGQQHLPREPQSSANLSMHAPPHPSAVSHEEASPHPQ